MTVMGIPSSMDLDKVSASYVHTNVQGEYILTFLNHDLNQV